jgi:hypothetical protein
MLFLSPVYTIWAWPYLSRITPNFWKQVLTPAEGGPSGLKEKGSPHYQRKNPCLRASMYVWVFVKVFCVLLPCTHVYFSCILVVSCCCFLQTIAHLSSRLEKLEKKVGKTKSKKKSESITPRTTTLTYKSFTPSWQQHSHISLLFSSRFLAS